MGSYTTSTTDEDLNGILELQKKNLPLNLTREEIVSQGFVTVAHRLEDLQKMNAIERHIIAKDNNKVVAYLLAMTERSKMDIPVLIPMFELFEKLEFKGQKLSAYNYIVIGQACVDKAYRGHGVFDGCYNFYCKSLKDKYDFAVTEIATSNLRSLRAHARVGFQTISEYTAPDNEAWSIVIWEWRH